jgi:hypothetical protein
VVAVQEEEVHVLLEMPQQLILVVEVEVLDHLALVVLAVQV